MSSKIFSIAILLALFNSCRQQNKIPMNCIKPETPISVQIDHPDCSLTDRSGNTWFTTAGGGVYRFDGRSCVYFPVKNSSCRTQVWSIFEDKEGMIWFGTTNSATYYDGKDFHDVPLPVYREHTFPAGLKYAVYAVSLRVNSISQDKDGTMCFGTKAGYFFYDRKKQQGC